jgi:predicted aspartyl protease
VNTRNEAIARLRVRGPGGVELDVDAIVDSGFTAALTLPAATVAALGLVRQWASSAVLADGSVRQFDICAAEVAWGGVWQAVLVSAVGNGAHEVCQLPSWSGVALHERGVSW